MGLYGCQDRPYHDVPHNVGKGSGGVLRVALPVSVRSTRYPAFRQSGKHRRTASRSGPGLSLCRDIRPVLAVDNASVRLARSHVHTGFTERLPLPRKRSVNAVSGVPAVGQASSHSEPIRSGALPAQDIRPVLAVDNASVRLARSRVHTGFTERLRCPAAHAAHAAHVSVCPSAHTTHDTPGPTVAMPRVEPERVSGLP